jgi:geranylgeranyl pyrophosphate synthase
VPHSDKTVTSSLRLEAEVGCLQSAIAAWIDGRSPEIVDLLRWQLGGGAKHYRPVTLFCCARAVDSRTISELHITRALLIELIHNMTLVVDDILDKSRYRRKKLTLHCRFGTLPALMTSGYIVAEVFRMAANDPDAVTLISELVSRLGVAECMQWRLRSQPLGVEDWRRIATEDTGSMFEVCACLGTCDERLRRFGQLLGLLYHGCDDVADVRGADGLGGGGADDLRDGILTLPASIAIRDPSVARLFCDPGKRGHAELAAAFRAVLPEAERRLDDIAREAKLEAERFADDPSDLIRLVEFTRKLSKR